MHIRRVFVVWIHPLFHESVRRLLSHPEIEWVGATSDRAAAREQIVKLRPDTILLEGEKSNSLLAEVLAILEADANDKRVIQLSLEGNELSIYRRECRTLGQASELVRLILAI